MPELPEVETVRRSLEIPLRGRRITGVAFAAFPGVIGEQSPEAFEALLVGRTIERLTRRGKYLFVHFDDESLLTIHLRMTGQLVATPSAAELLRFQHLAIHLDNATDLRFADQRKFGRVLWGASPSALSASPSLGPEPLEATFSAERLQSISSHRATAIKNVLLDQHAVAGIGNIYADEALYRARIHPSTPANLLDAAAFRRLHRAIREVLRAAIDNRGTTLSNYRDGAGERGDNQSRLRAYGRGRRGDPCLRCGSVMNFEVVGGRSSHFCPRCQAMPGS